MATDEQASTEYLNLMDVYCDLTASDQDIIDAAHRTLTEFIGPVITKHEIFALMLILYRSRILGVKS